MLFFIWFSVEGYWKMPISLGASIHESLRKHLGCWRTEYRKYIKEGYQIYDYYYDQGV